MIPDHVLLVSCLCYCFEGFALHMVCRAGGILPTLTVQRGNRQFWTCISWAFYWMLGSVRNFPLFLCGRWVILSRVVQYDSHESMAASDCDTSVDLPGHLCSCTSRLESPLLMGVYLVIRRIHYLLLNAVTPRQQNGNPFLLSGLLYLLQAERLSDSNQLFGHSGRSRAAPKISGHNSSTTAHAYCKDLQVRQKPDWLLIRSGQANKLRIVMRTTATGRFVRPFLL